jgi:microcin C transport system ATP-binding protein
MNLLEVTDLRIAFAGQAVVQGISFQIRAGERLALVGESGSGKTISALSLLGLVDGAQIQGKAVFDGRATATATATAVADVNADANTATQSGKPSTALMEIAEPIDLLAATQSQLEAIRGQDIAMVFQEPMTALNPLFSIGEQIAEVLRIKKGMPAQAAWQRAVELLADTGIAEPERRAKSFPHQLSGGQRQRAVIAMALACQPKLLLADEPTTALDVGVRQQILQLLQAIQTKYGMAVLLITHDLNLVRRFAQRIAVMQNGHIVEQGSVEAVFNHPQHPYTQRLLNSQPRRNVLAAVPDAAVLLQTQQLGVTYPVPRAGWRGWFVPGTFAAVRAVSMALPQGQTLGVMGESGSGKSTLALAVLGLLAFTGTVAVVGQTWGQGRRAQLRMRKDIQVVFQDPFSSLSPRLTVEEIVEEGLRLHAPALSAQAVQQQVLEVLAQVGLTQAQFPDLLKRYPHQFSGGQRQRIAIARALIVRPRIMVLDEPTSALDVTMAQQILQLLQRLQAEMGLAFLLITHDVDVIRAMAHQVMVMRNGEVLESGAVQDVLERPQTPYTQELLRATQ